MKFIQQFFLIWFRLAQPIRYVIVGGGNTVVAYGLYCLCYWFLGRPQLSLCLSFFLSTPISFLSQKFLVFRTRGHYFSEYIRCLMSWMLSSYCLNIILLFLLLRVVNAYMAQMVAQIIVAICSWLLLKHFAFRGKV